MKSLQSHLLLVVLVLSVGLTSFAQAALPQQLLIEQVDLSRSNHPGTSIEKSAPALTRELTAMVNASRPAPDPVMQRWTVAQPGVKISVKTEGMYRVTRAELQSAGFPVDSDSANWRLFMNGNEQAILVGDGGDYIDFYGRGVDTVETDTRIYYLINDTVAGKRMISKFLGPIGGGVISNNYRVNTEKKERENYNPNIQNGDAENYFGRAVISDPVGHVTIALTGIDPQGSNALIQVNLQGLLNTAHSVHVVINGVDAGIVTGSGTNHFSGTFVLPQTSLIEGINSIALNTLASNDVCYFDSITVNYSRRYAADQNRVLFYTPGYRGANVTGFTSSNIRVFDTTLDGDPEMILNPLIEQIGSTYTVRMPSNRPAVFYAVEDSGLLQSPSVTFDDPSTLGTLDNFADMIIISYGSPDFMAAAETWANYRRSTTGGSFTVKVVDVADVFDEFGYGLHTAQAIKDFLAYTQTNWQSPHPAYVLLLGDASYDHRNYEGHGYWDLVPAKNVSLVYEEAASDDALADFDNDGVADIAIGRIPARNGASVLIVLNKTMAFETSANQMISRGALFAYDLPLGNDFEATCHMLANQLPPRMPILFVPRGLPQPNPNQIEDPLAHQHLIDGINAGKYIVDYCGHASASVWGSQSFFRKEDVPALTNASNPSIFAVLPDFNGLFTRPNDDSLGEALLKAPNGGAAVIFSSTTVPTPDTQLALSLQFYHLLGAGNIPRMGDIVNASKQSISGSITGYGWTLLGDPAIKVR